MDIQLFSKYRKECVGLAILLIMYCHSTISVNLPYVDLLYVYTTQIAQVGVDIFFFLSGFGLYTSFYKQPNCVSFYKKRFIRIIPKYCVVIIAFVLVSLGVHLYPVKTVLFRYSLVTFFSHGVLAEWFIAAILVLYLIFPVLYYIVTHFPKASLIAIPILLVGSLAISVLNIFYFLSDTVGTVNSIFITRIPSFLLGMILARRYAEGGIITMRFRSIVIVFVVSVACCILNIRFNTINKWCVTRILFFPLSFSIIAIYSSIRDDTMTKLRRLLQFFGSITLELYLLHEKVQEIAWHYFEKYRYNMPVSIVLNILTVAISVLMAVALSKVKFKKPLIEEKKYNE